MTWIEQSVLVACDQRRCLMRSGDHVVTVSLDVDEPAEQFAARLRALGLDAIRSRCVDARDYEALRKQLERLRFVSVETGGPPHEYGPAVPLAALHAHLDEDRDRSTVTFVTHTEALVVKNASQRLLSRAVRMFISRMDDPYRMAVYGAVVARPDLVVASGDAPSSDDFAWLAATETDDGATSFSFHRRLATGSVVELEGRLQVHGRLAESEVIDRKTLRSPSGTQIHIASGRTAHPNLRVVSPFDSPESFVSGTTGVSLSPDMADLKARVEGIERFVSGDLSPDELTRAPAQDLPGSWLDPRQVIRYSARQMSVHRLSGFDPARDDWWVIGSKGGLPCYVPASLVFSPFPAVPDWHHWSATSSSGVAAHTTQAQAALSAWLEAVERDAFQRFRLSRGVIGQRLLPERLNGEGADLVALARKYGALTLIRMPSPTGVHVSLARIDTLDGVCLGMSAAASLAASAEKALTEAVAQATGPFLHDVKLEELRGPGDHAALYAQPQWRNRLAWMLSLPVAHISMPEVNPVVPAHAAQYEFRNATQTDIHVVRVIDPDLIPLTFGFDTDPLGRPDVQQLVQSGGWDGASPLDPHPFA